MIADPCELTFVVADAEPIIREVFADRLARTLWLGIKGSHIVSTTFNADCLTVARWIREHDGPVSGRWLTVSLQNVRIIGSAETYGDVLAPYANGEKEITWVEDVKDERPWSDP